MSRQPDGVGPAPPDTVRLVAEVAFPSQDGTRWLRILGDDRRGYLLVGDLEPADAAPISEYWHPSLELALDAAAAAGVPRSAWEMETRPPQPRPGR